MDWVPWCIGIEIIDYNIESFLVVIDKRQGIPVNEPCAGMVDTKIVLSNTKMRSINVYACKLDVWQEKS